jgi:hypothetical protein
MSEEAARERDEEPAHDEDDEQSEGGDETDTVDYGAMFRDSYSESGETTSVGVAMLAHFVQTFGHVLKLDDVEFADVESAFASQHDETQEQLLRTVLRVGDKRARLNEWQQRVRRVVRNEVARHRGRFDVFGAHLETETQLFLTKKRFLFMDASRQFKFAVIPLLLAQACDADIIVNAADALAPDELREDPIVFDAAARTQWFSFDRPEQRATARIYREQFSFDAQGRGRSDEWRTLCSTAEQMRDLRTSLERADASKSERELLRVINSDLIERTEAIEREALAKARSRERKQKRLQRLGHALTYAALFDEGKRRRPPPGAYAVDAGETRRSARNGGHARGAWADEPTQVERSSSTLSRGERAARREQQIVMQRAQSELELLAPVDETPAPDDANVAAPPPRKKRARRNDDEDSWGNDDSGDESEQPPARNGHRIDDDDDDAGVEEVESAAALEEQRRAAQERLMRPVKARLEPVATVAFSPGGHAEHDDDDEDDDEGDAWNAATTVMKKSGGVTFD